MVIFQEGMGLKRGVDAVILRLFAHGRSRNENLIARIRRGMGIAGKVRDQKPTSSGVCLGPEAAISA